MSEVERICPACNAANEPDAYFCGTCAAPLRSALALRSQSALALPEAAWPVRWTPRTVALGMGVGAMALRLGSALLRRAGRALVGRRVAKQEEPPPPVAAPRRVRLHVRRFWVVGGTAGVQQWGCEEITVEE